MRKHNKLKIVLMLFVFIKKYPKSLYGIFLIGGLFYAYEVLVGRPNATYMGVPKAESFSLDTVTRVFRNEGFMVGYSDYRGNPLWVSYMLTPIPANAKRYKRPSSFSKDWRNITSIKAADYTHSGYDRGHMAPNYAISRLYGVNAQKDTFEMTNITPQKPNLNRKVWQRLEEIGVSEFSKHFDKVWVFTGPIFDKNIQRLKSSNFVEIPDAFYKIYIGVSKNKSPKALAFIMPQSVRGRESLLKFVTTIDKVEEKTGFDFFHKLDDKIESKMERSKDYRPWNLKSVATKPSRY
ncbi:MAG: DNA/RNA non-specific endonuclease [Sulfurovum sp.]|nr:DNA/RNA non-specific endonuclease [Sulfurovum sp.]